MLGIFKSKEQDTIEQVRGKLAKAQQAVTLAIQEQRAQSLAVALSDDENAGRPIAEKIQQLRGRVELLEQALILAEENEARRLAKARAEAEKSRNLAIRAHIGTLVKAALKYQVATYNSVLAWRDMLAAGESIAKLLPADRALAEAVSY